MKKLYQEEVYLKFNTQIEKWELLLIENDKVIDSATTLVKLIHDYDCLK